MGLSPSDAALAFYRIPTKRIAYTFGSDEVSQTVTTFNPTTQAVLTTEVHMFGHDGHGSVRVLFDAASKLAQAYTYAAYGELLAIHNGLGASSGNAASAALTSMLYNGESFDSRIGQLYLRARWYDGHRFTTIDPYAGDSSNPMSFNKYSFATGGDPILFADPTGMFEGLVGMIGSMAIRSQMNMMPPGPDDLVQSAYESLMEAYSVNLEWDVGWALDLRMEDWLTSRSDEHWVQYAILRGLLKSYDDWLGQFTGAPDLLGLEGGAVSASRPSRSRTSFRGGNTQRATIPHNGTMTTVSFYSHPRFRNGESVVIYPRSVRAQELPIDPEPLPHGQTWESIPRNEKTRMRAADIRNATKELKKRNGDRLPDGYKPLDGGQMEVNGVPHTWHHDYKRGNMQLIPTDLHNNSQKKANDGSTHIGMALWHRVL